eukprot:823985-Pyramimonas_sp.AAC.1
MHSAALVDPQDHSLELPQQFRWYSQHTCVRQHVRHTPEKRLPVHAALQQRAQSFFLERGRAGLGAISFLAPGRTSDRN